MVFSNPTQEELRALLLGTKTIAMVGASSSTDRPSNGVMRKLLSVGYHVIPVNPNETEVLGQKAYPSLEAVPEKVDLVDVFRRSEATPPIAEQAVRIGAKGLWLQQGVWSDEAAATAKAGGLTVVMDLCIAVMHTLLALPRK
jgi:predicted CoA-binding protein